MRAKQHDEQQTASSTGDQRSIWWDDSEMKSSYANVTNVSSTRDDVSLVFGIHQSWEPSQTDMTVQLSNRIILSPCAAKRLAILLSNVMREYEMQFGELNLAGLRREQPSAS